MSRATIYYNTKYEGSGRWRIYYWTKPDRSNKLSEMFVTLDEVRIRNRLEAVLGHKNFDLYQVKGD